MPNTVLLRYNLCISGKDIPRRALASGKLQSCNFVRSACGSCTETIDIGVTGGLCLYSDGMVLRRLWIVLSIVLCFNAQMAFADEKIKVLIEGLDDPEKSNVEAALVVPTGLTEESRIDDKWLKRFENQIPEKVSDALAPFGYYRAHVGVTQETDAEGLHTLRVNVDKGDPVRIISVKIDAEGPGAKEENLQNRIAGFPLHKGDVLRQDIYELEKTALQQTTVDLGYLDAAFSVHTIAISIERLEVEIELMLQTGLRYRFGDTTFSENAGYPPTFLGRYLAFKKGDVFSHKKLAETQTNLISTDRFERVNIQPKQERVENNYIPIDIEVIPSAPKRFKIGAGYGTDTGPRGSLYYRDNNVARKGHEFSAELKAGTVLQGLAASYTVPGNRDTNTYTSLKAAIKREDTQSYLTKSVTLEGERTRSFGTGQTGSFFVQLLQEDSEAGEDRTNAFLIIPGVRFSGRRYDQLLRPTKGFRYQMELRGADRALGSSTDLLQILSSGEVMYPLPFRLSAFARVKAGMTMRNESVEDLPISLRFFAGGDNSVRGYPYQSLGPKGENGEVIGGKHLLTANFELERAIGKNWGVAAFYDFGNAFNSISNMGIAQGAGLGVRYYTPIGPIKLDLARQIGVKDPGYRIHFSIGLEL
jgi:translocation and assembly module TamA